MGRTQRTRLVALAVLRPHVVARRAAVAQRADVHIGARTPAGGIASRAADAVQAWGARRGAVDSVVARITLVAVGSGPVARLRAAGHALTRPAARACLVRATHRTRRARQTSGIVAGRTRGARRPAPSRQAVTRPRDGVADRRRGMVANRARLARGRIRSKIADSAGAAQRPRPAGVARAITSAGHASIAGAVRAAVWTGRCTCGPVPPQGAVGAVGARPCSGARTGAVALPPICAHAAIGACTGSLTRRAVRAGDAADARRRPRKSRGTAVA